MPSPTRPQGLQQALTEPSVTDARVPTPPPKPKVDRARNQRIVNAVMSPKESASRPRSEIHKLWQTVADTAVQHERQYTTKESARALLGKARKDMPIRAPTWVSILNPEVTDPILESPWSPKAFTRVPVTPAKESVVEHKRAVSLFRDIDTRNSGAVSLHDMGRILCDLGMPQTDRQLEAVLKEIRGDHLPHGADIPFELFKSWYNQQLSDEKEEEKLAATGTLKNFWLPPVSRHHLKTPSAQIRGALRPGSEDVATPRSDRAICSPSRLKGMEKRSRQTKYRKREMASIKVLIKNGDTTGAAFKLNNAIEQYPRAASLRTLRSMILIREGNMHESEVKQLEADVRQLRACKGFGEGSSGADDKSTERELLANIKEADDAAKDCWSNALTDAKRAIVVSPKEIKAYYWAGMSAGKLGRPDEAMLFIQKCLEHSPGDQRYRAAFDEFHPESQQSRPYRAHGECAYIPVITLRPNEGATNRVPSVRPFIPKPGQQVAETRPPGKRVPPERKRMEESWKRVDLSDIVFELTIIHEAIVGALADGEVDDDEAYLIDTKLKAAGIPTKLRKQIKQGLDGEDKPETLDMLKSMCPPGFHRGAHGPENVYAQPLVRSTLKAALIACKSPWQPAPPGYVDETTLRELGVPARTRRILVNAMMRQDGTMAPEGKVFNVDEEMVMRHLCSKLPVDHALDAAEKFDTACGLLPDDILEADDPDSLEIVDEILQHRSQAIAEGLKYASDPTQSEYEEPLFQPFKCGCSITNCVQCTTDCDDWDKILADLDENHGVYKTLFRLYGLASDGRPEMNKSTFQDFCVRMNITDESDAKTRPAGVGRIHLRANIDHAQPKGGPWIDFYDRQFVHPKLLRAERDQIESEVRPTGLKEEAALDHCLSMKQFLAALIRSAYAKYQNIPGLYHRWLNLIENNLPKPEELMETIEDELTAIIEWPEVQYIFLRHHITLEVIFLQFCKSDKTDSVKGAKDMMNIKEFVSCLKEADLLGDALTELEAKQIFASVNLDDDLYESDDAGDSADELVFHEFCECLVRVAVELCSIDGVPLRSWVSEILEDGEAHQNEKETFVEEVNGFIMQSLVPVAERITTQELKVRMEKKQKMTWHQLQLESGPSAKKGSDSVGRNARSNSKLEQQLERMILSCASLHWLHTMLLMCTVVTAMKAFARDFASQNGMVDQSHSIEIWKKTYTKLGLSDCPSQKVFQQFLAKFKP